MEFDKQVSFVINAGGKSSRLASLLKENKNKSWLTVNNQAIIEANIKEFAGHVNEILIIVKNSELKELFESMVCQLKLPLEVLKKIQIRTEIHGERISGPLAGVLASIKLVRNEVIYFAPNDHPYLSFDDYFAMHSNLKADTIVSIKGKGQGNEVFDPNLFVCTKKTLVKFSSNFKHRITDLYRSIENVIFLEKITDIHTLQGINTIQDRKELKNKVNIGPKLSNKVIHKNNTQNINIRDQLSQKKFLMLEKDLWSQISSLITKHIQSDINKIG